MTLPLDADIGKALALVVDGNPASRRALVNMLRGFGVARVEQASRPQDARRMLELRFFDIVLCDFHFPDSSINGRELMDDLRQSGLLPLPSVVVMISGEADYGHVAEAAEVALDAYLLKPHTAEALGSRLAKARERKRALGDMFALIAADRHADAVALARAKVEARGVAWLQAARIGADLCLRLGRPADSAQLLEAVLATGALPWARLGLARAQTESGAVFQARRTLESLIGELPGYADAYDVMGRVLLEQGDNAEAIATLRKASALTPNSVGRLVKFGLLAFYFGDAREASEALSRAVRLGMSSKVFDLQGLTLLAALQFDQGDERGLSLSALTLDRMRAAAPNSARLRRFGELVEMFRALLDRRVGEAMALLRGQLAELREPNFEFEAACNLLMALSRLDAQELRLDDLEHHVGQLAARFAVSRTTCELMCAALRGRGAAVAVVREQYDRTNAIARDAVERTVGGDPAAAAEALLAAAELTLNAKLMDLAEHTLDRHRDAIAGADTLYARVRQLHETYRSYGTQVRMARIDDARSMQAVSRPD